jgi:hypothetical protein
MQEGPRVPHRGRTVFIITESPFQKAIRCAIRFGGALRGFSFTVRVLLANRGAGEADPHQGRGERRVDRRKDTGDAPGEFQL